MNENEKHVGENPSFVCLRRRWRKSSLYLDASRSGAPLVGNVS